MATPSTGLSSAFSPLEGMPSLSPEAEETEADEEADHGDDADAPPTRQQQLSPEVERMTHSLYAQHAVSLIQARFRGNAARRSLEATRRSVAILSRVWRSRRAARAAAAARRAQATRSLAGAVAVQRAWRAFVARRAARVESRVRQWEAAEDLAVREAAGRAIRAPSAATAQSGGQGAIMVQERRRLGGGSAFMRGVQRARRASFAEGSAEQRHARALRAAHAAARERMAPRVLKAVLVRRWEGIRRRAQRAREGAYLRQCAAWREAYEASEAVRRMARSLADDLLGDDEALRDEAEAAATELAWKTPRHQRRNLPRASPPQRPAPLPRMLLPEELEALAGVAARALSFMAAQENAARTDAAALLRARDSAAEQAASEAAALAGQKSAEAATARMRAAASGAPSASGGWLASSRRRRGAVALAAASALAALDSAGRRRAARPAWRAAETDAAAVTPPLTLGKALSEELTALLAAAAGECDLVEGLA